MATITNYAIHCTEQQTKKALELGVPIELARVIDTIEGKSIRIPEERGEFYLIPTAEQMINWLTLRQKIIVEIYCKGIDKWAYCVNFSKGEEVFGSRQAATLAAIDVALKLLNKYKKEQYKHMSNIFENAQFGDKFRTREGWYAVYDGTTYFGPCGQGHIVHELRYRGKDNKYCITVLRCENDGSLADEQHRKNSIDIVGRWEETK